MSRPDSDTGRPWPSTSTAAAASAGSSTEPTGGWSPAVASGPGSRSGPGLGSGSDSGPGLGTGSGSSSGSGSGSGVRRGQRGRLPLWTRHLFGDRWLGRAGDRGPELADLEGAVEDGPGRSGREGLGALALLEQDDRATQEAAVEHGEGPLVEGRGHVDDDHVGVADDAVEVLAVPVDHADPAGGLDQGAEGAGEHVVPRDQDDPEGGALGTGDGLAGPCAGARERGGLGAVGADRLAGPRLGAGRGWLGGRGGAAPAALGPAGTVAHRAAPAPSGTLVAETTRLSR